MEKDTVAEKQSNISTEQSSFEYKRWGQSLGAIILPDESKRNAKSKEQLQIEAEEVLAAVGEKVKSEAEQAIHKEEIDSLSMLTDSYSRLYELLK